MSALSEMTTLGGLMASARQLECESGALQGICIYGDGTVRVFYSRRALTTRIAGEAADQRSGIFAPTAEAAEQQKRGSHE